MRTWKWYVEAICDALEARRVFHVTGPFAK